LTALWVTSPEEAAFEVKLALDAEGGDADAAAARLGISRSTVFRYLKRLKVVKGKA